MPSNLPQYVVLQALGRLDRLRPRLADVEVLGALEGLHLVVPPHDVLVGDGGPHGEEGEEARRHGLRVAAQPAHERLRRRGLALDRR
jgi:hypothetical protein